MPLARQAFGYTYYSYSLHDWRQLRSVRDIPRAHWSILQRPATNYQLRNRIDHRDGAVPQLGGVDHIGAGFEDRVGLDTGAELLNEYGLNPGNTRASWNAAGDSDTIVLLAPPDTRPWQHGVTGSPYDLNSWAIGYEDGIQSTNWDALPEPKRTAHLRMRAAFWALFFGDPDLGWELKYTATADAVWDHIRRGKSWGLTQHGTMDPAQRTDAGYVYRGGQRVNTFPYERELLPMIRQEMGIRTSGQVGTPGLPAASEQVTRLQGALNEYGHNLDIDGSFGPLTETAAKDVAAGTGYTGDVKDAAFITHLEVTMSTILEKLDALPQRVWAYQGPHYKGDAWSAQVEQYRSIREAVAHAAAAHAALAALAAQTGGVDPAVVTEAARKGAEAALSNLRLVADTAIEGA